MFGPSSMSPVYVLDAPGQNPFSPRGFLRGEKVPKADEGGALRGMRDIPTLVRERSKARE